MTSSRISGFYNLTLDERRAKIADTAPLTSEDLLPFMDGGLTPDAADHMIENVIGMHSLPLGIGLNFQVNGRDVLVPMVIEEPSVVAGASYAARLARQGGGFACSSTEPLMISQIQILDLADWDRSVMTNVPGESGNPESKHYSDLLEDWAAGRYHPMPYSRKAVEAATVERIRLLPTRPYRRLQPVSP